MTLENAVKRIKKNIPSFYLTKSSICPVTSEFYDGTRNNAQTSAPNIIRLAATSHEDIQLLLENYSKLDEMVQRRIVLHMRLMKRDLPQDFKIYKQLLPVDECFNFGRETVLVNLLNWDRVVMPYLPELSLKVLSADFSELNSQLQNILIEYINAYVQRYPLNSTFLKAYIECRDPKNPLLKITALDSIVVKCSIAKEQQWDETNLNLSKNDTLNNQGLQETFHGWDGVTVPYLHESALQRISKNYTKLYYFRKQFFLKYLYVLNDKCPEQTQMLKQYLLAHFPSNTLLNITPLVDIDMKLAAKQNIIQSETNSKHSIDPTVLKQNSVNVSDHNLENSKIINHELPSVVSQYKSIKLETTDVGATSIIKNAHIDVENNVKNTDCIATDPSAQLKDWDERIFPFYGYYDLQHALLNYKLLSFEKKETLMKYINKLHKLFPEQINTLRKYVKHLDRNNPVLKLGPFATKPSRIGKCRQAKLALENWDNKTVPYFNETHLKRVCLNYRVLKTAYKESLLVYLKLLKTKAPEQTEMLQVYLEASDSSNPLLQICVLSDTYNKHTILEPDTLNVQANNNSNQTSLMEVDNCDSYKLTDYNLNDFL